MPDDNRPRVARSPQDARSPRTRSRMFGALALGAGSAIAAALAATHPAIADSALASIASAVTCATTTACVSGTNTNAGPGVLGSSKSSYGVEGTSTSNDGLRGVSTSSNGLSAVSSSLYGVKGVSTSSYGVWGSTTYGKAGVAGTGGSYGVYGYTATGSTSGIGVGGTSTGAYGSGVYGYAYGAGTGVAGFSYNGNSVSGNSTYGVGVSGQSGSNTGVYASSDSQYGLSASSSTGDAIFAQSSSNVGADISGNSTAVIARSPNNVFSGFDSNGNSVFYVDSSGNIGYTGGLYPYTKNSLGTMTRSFSARSAAPTVEDTGSAQLVAGAAAVRLDPTFASSIDPRETYRVFITPDGDTRGLYVAAKTPAGFIVRETQAGRSTLAFDYRIVATALGQVGQRMTTTSVGMLPRNLPRPFVKVPPASMPPVPTALSRR